MEERPPPEQPVEERPFRACPEPVEGAASKLRNSRASAPGKAAAPDATLLALASASRCWHFKLEGQGAMDSSIMTGLAFFLFVAGVLIYTAILYNGLVRLRNENDRAWANIDVLLKQRHDEIPNLVETVKGYMQHEQQTLLAVTQARSASMNAASIPQKAVADLKMETALRSLFAVAENYPQLKANENFLKLQNSHQRTRRAHRRPPRIFQRRRQHLQHPHRPNPRRLRSQLPQPQAAPDVPGLRRRSQTGRSKVRVRPKFRRLEEGFGWRSAFSVAMDASLFQPGLQPLRNRYAAVPSFALFCERLGITDRRIFRAFCGRAAVEEMSWRSCRGRAGLQPGVRRPISFGASAPAALHPSSFAASFA